MGDEICNLGIFDLARLYRLGEVSPVEVISAHLKRCERLNPPLNAFLAIFHESANHSAKAMEALFKAGIDLGPLQGVPVSVKDIIRVRGTQTTAGSRIFLQEPPDQNDAVVVQRLRAAGAIIIGKTNLHEFASGDPDPTAPFGLVQNPRRIGYNPGMSSSGAGAAVAAGLGIIAIGTDTGGSIRIPACLCGVCGLKPTTGRISMEGIIPLSSSLDTVGPLARRVSDVAMAFDVCAGQPVKETWVANQTAAYSYGQPDGKLCNWRVGVPVGEYFDQLQPGVASSFRNTLKVLGDLGCQVVDFDPPGADIMVELTAIIIQAEGAAYHEQYRDREELYGANFRERIFAGREHKAMAYIHARQRQLELQQEWLERANHFDVVVVPSAPVGAPPHGVTAIQIGDVQFPYRAVLSRFTRPFNLLGWPALTVPNGLTSEGLPTGVQIAGPPDSEWRLLVLGHRLEEALGLVDKLGIELYQQV